MSTIDDHNFANEQGIADDVADSAENVGDHPVICFLLSTGWAAKGLVYGLMGVIALAISVQRGPSSDEASPQGAVSALADRPFGRLMLVALAVGLIFYVGWRLLSVALIRDHDIDAWLHRIGYFFSAAVYSTLAWSAVTSAIYGGSPERSSTIERLSVALLGSTPGRVLLGLGGAVALGVGVYFFAKGVRRSFLEDLDIDDPDSTHADVVEALGVVGWVGRAAVTGLVGGFVAWAALTADSSDAMGFDRLFRDLTTKTFGNIFVIVLAGSLMAYGAYCILSIRYRSVEQMVES